MSEFFAMGGYAMFLWPAYLLTLVALIANIVIVCRAHAEARLEAKRRIAMEDEEDRQ